MQFRVFDKNPVNVNVCYIPTGQVSSQLSLVNCNYKYITPTKITVEASKPFYYAVDENNRAWRTTDIQYITNTKVMLTMISQTLESFKTTDDSYAVIGDIGITPYYVGDNEIFNRLASSPSTWLSMNKNKLYSEVYKLFDENEGTIAWENYCILQTINPIFIGDGTTETKYIVDLWYTETNRTEVETRQRTYANYGLIDTNAVGSIGVYTYLIRLDLAQSDINAYIENVCSFLTQLSSSENGQNVINARFIRVPATYFDDSTTVDFVISKASASIPPVIPVKQLVQYIPKQVVIDHIGDDNLLEGRAFWKIGNNIIYPNKDATGLSSLYLVIILGVGTCVGFFFTGYYSDTMVNEQSSCCLELGYNIAPNTVGESLYYSNKQFASIVDSMPLMRVFANIGNAVGSALITPGGAGSRLAMAGVSLVSSSGSVAQLRANREREQSNHGSLNNVNDVQNLASYMGNNVQAFRIESYEADVQTLAQILGSYLPHTFKSYVIPEEIIILKCSSIPGEVNTQLYKEGCIVAKHDNLVDLLYTANI